MLYGRRLLTSCQRWPKRCCGRRQLSGPVGRLDGTRRRWSGSFVAGNWTAPPASYASWLINHVPPPLRRQKADLFRRRNQDFSVARWSLRRKVFLSVFIMYRDLQRSLSSDTRSLMTYPGIFMTPRHFLMRPALTLSAGQHSHGRTHVPRVPKFTQIFQIVKAQTA